ncbi:MAG: hypothetical protein ACRDP7_45930 [Trebonia sp.]
MKNLLPWLIAVVVAWLILHNPAAAAADIRNFFHALSAFVNAL